MIDINADLLQWFINFANKKVSVGTVKNDYISNKELAKELNKPIIRKLYKRKVKSPFMDNIWGTDVADMQLKSKFNKGFRFCYVLLTFMINVHGLFL